MAPRIGSMPAPFSLPCLAISPPYGQKVAHGLAEGWDLQPDLIAEIRSRVDAAVQDAVLEALGKAGVLIHMDDTCGGKPVRIYGENTGEGIEDCCTCRRCQATKRVIERGAGG